MARGWHDKTDEQLERIRAYHARQIEVSRARTHVERSHGTIRRIDEELERRRAAREKGAQQP